MTTREPRVFRASALAFRRIRCCEGSRGVFLPYLVPLVLLFSVFAFIEVGLKTAFPESVPSAAALWGAAVAGSVSGAEGASQEPNTA